jgi:hypothetical protein
MNLHSSLTLAACCQWSLIRLAPLAGAETGALGIRREHFVPGNHVHLDPFDAWSIDEGTLANVAWSGTPGLAFESMFRIPWVYALPRSDSSASRSFEISVCSLPSSG